MTVNVTHSKVSSAAEGSDPSQVRASDWNAGHVVTGVTDEKVKTSASDTTADYLGSKLVAGTNITLTESSSGSRTITIAASSGGGSTPPGTSAIFDECMTLPLTSAIATSNGLFLENSGGGSGVSQLTGASNALAHPGIIRFTTGTTTTGRAGERSSLLMEFGTGGGAMSCGAIIRIPTLSNGTDTFTVYAGGIRDTISTDTSVNGFYFRYTDAVNGGRWQAVAADAFHGSSTATDTGVAPTANTFQNLAIIINNDNTSVTYYIDGSLVATITSSLTNQVVGYAPVSINKSAGTNARTVDLDVYWYIWTLTR